MPEIEMGASLRVIWGSWLSACLCFRRLAFFSLAWNGPGCHVQICVRSRAMRQYARFSSAREGRILESICSSNTRSPVLVRMPRTVRQDTNFKLFIMPMSTDPEAVAEFDTRKQTSLFSRKPGTADLALRALMVTRSTPH